MKYFLYRLNTLISNKSYFKRNEQCPRKGDAIQIYTLSIFNKMRNKIAFASAVLSMLFIATFSKCCMTEKY